MKKIDIARIAAAGADHARAVRRHDRPGSTSVLNLEP
jgi:hypothetical protein